MIEPDKFTMTEQHLALLKRMYVGWQDCEYGAPEIDPKRPYGDSSVVLDIAEILGVPVNDEDDDYGLDRETYGRLERLHRETETALQIILFTQSFRVGTYTRKPYSSEWEKV